MKSGRPVQALDIEDAGHVADRADHFVEVFHIEDFDSDFDASAIVGCNRGFGFADARLDVGDGAGYAGDHAGAILCDGEQFDGVSRVIGFARPFDLDDPFRIDHQLLHILTAPRVHDDAFAARDVTDNRFAVHRVATTRARNQHIVHTAHDDGVVAQTHEPLDGLHAASKFRLFALFEFGELFGAEEFGDHVARHDLAVADGGEQIINAPETVIVGDALEVAVGSVQEFLG